MHGAGDGGPFGVAQHGDGFGEVLGGKLHGCGILATARRRESEINLSAVHRIDDPGSEARADERIDHFGRGRERQGQEVGDIAEHITVEGGSSLVETRKATLGIVVDEQQIVDLPLNGRNFTQLGTLVPGVVAPPVALGGQNGNATPGGIGNVTGGFNVNGMRNQSNNFLLDGASNNDTFNTGFVLRPPPDAIQEFKILTHAYDAEYGRNAGLHHERTPCLGSRTT